MVWESWVPLLEGFTHDTFTKNFVTAFQNRLLVVALVTRKRLNGRAQVVRFAEGRSILATEELMRVGH